MPNRLGEYEQPIGRVGPAIEDHVLDALQQVFRDFLVDLELARIDDSHVKACADGVVQEHRVHRPANNFLAAEAEADVADPARCLGQREAPLQFADRLKELDRIVVVLHHPGADDEDVRVEYDVGRVESNLFGQQLVSAFADGHLALGDVRLPDLVKCHDHNCRAIALDQPGLFEELLFALLEADRVDDALALETLQSRFNNLPFRAVDHDWDLGKVRLRGDQPEEAGHRLLTVDQFGIHVDIEDVGAILDLLLGDGDGGVEVALLDQPFEFERTGDVAALADHNEVRLWPDD